MGERPAPDDLHLDPDQAREQVAGLLAAAGLRVPAEEVDRLASLYSGLRRSLDRYHAVPTDDEVPAAVFRAAEARVDTEPGADSTGGVRP